MGKDTQGLKANIDQPLILMFIDTRLTLLGYYCQKYMDTLIDGWVKLWEGLDRVALYSPALTLRRDLTQWL